MPVKEYTNRLINEKSPYLLQHAHNPVDWYPWGEEAFEKAERENKPVFLSIGYSTCHWCHVMAHESFEDEDTARILNRDFVAVKVDKEERPDIDAVYMAVCQALTGQGGWPLTIIMTPDKKPFFAGTYFPKKSRYGMPGLADLLNAVTDKWNTQKQSLLASGEKIAGLLAQERQQKGFPSRQTVRQAAQVFSRSYDDKNGGFGERPKFPTPHNLLFLMRYAKAEQDPFALRMAETTLRRMFRGGIFDHIGGGFCRYSTDEQWLVPHFEKMLYDNALLTMAYLEAYQITKNAIYKQTAERTLAYISAEMTSPEGGFYSAQDADSDGVEGKYYVFTPHEINDVLGREDGEVFAEYFGMTHHGNFEGANIPNLLHNPEYDKKREDIGRMCQTVYDYRKHRTALHRDDKILTAWNALMIVAYCKAGRVLGQESYLQQAQRAMGFLEEKLKDGEKLHVYWRNGESRGEGTLDDYAFTVWAYLELYRATFAVGWMDKAIRLNHALMQGFFDYENGGCYIYGSGGEKLIARPKEVYDGAIPSGNSVTAYNLQLLALMTGDAELSSLAQAQLGFIAGHVEEHPAGYSFSLLAFMLALYPAREIVCVLPDESELPAVRAALDSAFLPETTVLVKTGENSERLAQAAPFTKDYSLTSPGVPTFYICEGGACSAPFTGVEELKRRLAEQESY